MISTMLRRELMGKQASARYAITEKATPPKPSATRRIKSTGSSAKRLQGSTTTKTTRKDTAMMMSTGREYYSHITGIGKEKKPVKGCDRLLNKIQRL